MTNQTLQQGRKLSMFEKIVVSIAAVLVSVLLMHWISGSGIQQRLIEMVNPAYVLIGASSYLGGFVIGVFHKNRRNE